MSIFELSKEITIYKTDGCSLPTFDCFARVSVAKKERIYLARAIYLEFIYEFYRECEIKVKLVDTEVKHFIDFLTRYIVNEGPKGGLRKALIRFFDAS